MISDQDRYALSHDRLVSLLDHDVSRGEFTWKVDRSNYIKAGTRAGTKSKEGYRVIRIDGVNYMEHRLIWFYVHGEWPVSEIDHRDCDRSDSGIGKLRPATRRQNAHNRKPRVGTVSGRKGVTAQNGEGRTNRWRARIKVNGKYMHLGYFSTSEEANAAYAVAAAKYFGEYARAS